VPGEDLVHEALEFALPAHSPEVRVSCAKGCTCVHCGVQAVHLRKVASLWPCSEVPPLFACGEEACAACALSALQASASSVSLQWKALYSS
jgi:ferredoxin